MGTRLKGLLRDPALQNVLGLVLLAIGVAASGTRLRDSDHDTLAIVVYAGTAALVLLAVLGLLLLILEHFAESLRRFNLYRRFRFQSPVTFVRAPQSPERESQQSAAPRMPLTVQVSQVEDGSRWVAVCMNRSGSALTNLYARVRYFDNDDDPYGTVDGAMILEPRDVLPAGAQIRVVLIGREPDTAKRYGISQDGQRTDVQEIINKIELTVYADGVEQTARFFVGPTHSGAPGMRVSIR